MKSLNRNTMKSYVGGSDGAIIFVHYPMIDGVPHIELTSFEKFDKKKSDELIQKLPVLAGHTVITVGWMVGHGGRKK